MHTIGVTGHRQLADVAGVINDIKLSFLFFKQINADLTAVSAVAAGADLIFAEEAIAQGIRLHIILPFEMEEYRKDFEASELQRLEDILVKAAKIDILTKSIIKSPEDRQSAYLAVGRHIVDISDAVLAIWDGEPAHGIGGTGDIIAYAKECKKELHLIRTERIITEKDNPVRVQFEKLDKEAVLYKKRKFEPAWMTGIVAGILAVFSFTIGKAFNFDRSVSFLFTIFEFVCLSISFVSLAIFAKRWKLKFLEKRRSAEYLRSILWYQKAGVPIPAAETLQYRPPSEILDLERTISAQITKIENVPNARRISWCLAKDQILYHSNYRIRSFKHRLERLEWWLEFLKVVFFIVTPLNFIFEVLNYYSIYNAGPDNRLLQFILFSALSIPPLYAALEGIKYFSEWKRDIAISEKIIFDLNKSMKDILNAGTEEKMLQETKKLRDVLELENNDWTLRYYEKEVGAKV